MYQRRVNHNNKRIVRYDRTPSDPKPNREGMVVPGTYLPKALEPTALTHWSNHLDTCSQCHQAFPAGGELCQAGAAAYLHRLQSDGSWPKDNTVQMRELRLECFKADIAAEFCKMDQAEPSHEGVYPTAFMEMRNAEEVADIGVLDGAFEKGSFGWYECVASVYRLGMSQFTAYGDAVYSHDVSAATSSGAMPRVIKETGNE